MAFEQKRDIPTNLERLPLYAALEMGRTWIEFIFRKAAAGLKRFYDALLKVSVL